MSAPSTADAAEALRRFAYSIAHLNSETSESAETLAAWHEVLMGTSAEQMEGACAALCVVTWVLDGEVEGDEADEEHLTAYLLELLQAREFERGRMRDRVRDYERFKEEVDGL